MHPIQRISGTLLLTHGSALLLIAAYILMNADNAGGLFNSLLGSSLGSVAVVVGSLLLRKTGRDGQLSKRQPSQLLERLSAALLLFDGGTLLLLFVHTLLLHDVVSAHPSSYGLVAFIGSTSVVVGGLLLRRWEPSDRIAHWRNAQPAERTLATSLLAYGVAILLLFAHSIATEVNSPFNALLAVVLGLPPIVVGGWWLRGAARKERSMELQDYSTAQQDALLPTFYRLIQQGDGRITVLHFAMESHLTQEMAKQYLDQKAREFDAEFELSDRGSIVYRFDLGYSRSDRTLNS